MVVGLLDLLKPKNLSASFVELRQKSHIKWHFSILRCEYYLFFFPFFQLWGPQSFPLKLKVPARLFVRRRAVCVQREVVKVAVVQWSVHLTEQRAWTRWCGRQTDAEEYSRSACTEGLCSPDGGLPSWSPRTTCRTIDGCHDYRVSSQNEREAPLLLVLLNILHSVFLISNPLWRIVPENRPQGKGCEKSRNFNWDVEYGRRTTCRVFWWGSRRSWWSSWGTRSCRCLWGWCCRSSWDRSRKMEGCRQEVEKLFHTESQSRLIWHKRPAVPATEQLKDQYPQRPAVSWTVVTFVQDDLGSNVLRSSAKGPRLLTQTHPFGKSKVHLQEQTHHMIRFSPWNPWVFRINMPTSLA